MARDAHPATRSFVSRTPIRLQAAMVLATIAAFSAMLALNQVLFRALEFAPGINYVYLPAGMRLLCTLLYFAWTGQHDLLRGFVAMFVGDLTGTLIVIYAIKALLSLAQRPLPRTG